MLGGVLTDYVHWSLIFWINLPLGLVALCDDRSRAARLPRNERPHKLDFVGAALMVAAAIALLLALELGRHALPLELSGRSCAARRVGRAVGAVRVAAA